jgi:hypothetical protein
MSKPIVCIDFDGVIHSYISPFNILDAPDPPVLGALDAMQRFIKNGWEVNVYSSRSHSPAGLRVMRDYLTRWAVAEGGDYGWTLEVVFPMHKPPAVVSIDDRGLTFEGDWSKFDPKELREFKPWNKRDGR